MPVHCPTLACKRVTEFCEQSDKAPAPHPLDPSHTQQQHTTTHEAAAITRPAAGPLLAHLPFSRHPVHLSRNTQLLSAPAPLTHQPTHRPITMAATLGDSPASNIDESLTRSGHREVRGQGGGRTFQVKVAEGGDGHLAWALAESQGMRSGMEDAHAILMDVGTPGPATGSANTGGSSAGGPQGPLSLFGVFDGHSGKEVAAFCAQHMPTQLIRTPGWAAGDVQAALRESFLSLDTLLRHPAHAAEMYALRQDMHVPPAPKPTNVSVELTAATAGNEPAGPMEQADTAAMEDAMMSGPGAAGGEKVDADAAQAHARAAAVESALPENVTAQLSEYGMRGEHGEYLGPRAGSTAVVALVGPSTLTVASVGDSRCIVSMDGHAVSLTQDHKPSDPTEHQRIITAGCFVAPHAPGGIPRVGGTLAMSRAMGDVKYKNTEGLPVEQQPVSAVPDTVEVGLAARAEFVVLACDGVWDVLDEQQVVDMVRGDMRRGAPLRDVARAVVARCLDGTAPGGVSTDNITFMLVVLKDGNGKSD